MSEELKVPHCSWLTWLPLYVRFVEWQSRAQGVDPYTGKTIEGLGKEAEKEIQIELEDYE
jgi:hypothetical protein